MDLLNKGNAGEKEQTRELRMYYKGKILKIYKIPLR
jgi:hypothetical protein